MGIDKHSADLKVAIVHDWLVGGGAERVVYELHQMFPDAPIYTSYCTNEWRKKLDHKVVTGFLQKWPFSKLRKFLPVLRIWWFTHLDLSGYDLVISSSGNGEAKGVKVPDGTKHICYCHTPTHFYWRHYDQYLKEPGFGIFNPAVRLCLKILAGPLRRWDLKAAQRPDVFIANSNHIKSDIKKYYGRDAVVIHPPIDIARFTNTNQNRQGFITIGRQVPYKRIDLIVKACSDLALPLTVVGRGPEHKKLVSLAGPSITFDDHASDKDVTRYMANAEAFIFAAFEDFGITPVEAMASGTPVIAYGAGGALDYVDDGVSGTLFKEQTAASLTRTLKAFHANSFNHQAVAKQAAKFSPEVFQQKISKLIEEELR